MKKNILIISLVLISTATNAQIEKINTDRPGKTNSPVTIPKNWVQVEVGGLRQRDKIYPDPILYKEIYFQHPLLLAKYAFSNRFELRAITELVTIKQYLSYKTSSVTGINSVQLGGKLNFLKEKGLRPNTSLIAHYVFPGLSTIYTGNDSIAGANFRFAMQHTISDNFLLGYNLGMEWQRFGSPPAYIYTFSPKFNIDEDWLIYVEIFGYIWKKDRPENSIAAGFAYYINDNIKVDASAGFGLNKKAPDNFLSIGASFRFKTKREN
jgi:Putative MetA-pathway of phenol degradation